MPKLTTQQRKAILEALKAGESQRAIATRLGVSKSTVARLKADPHPMVVQKAGPVQVVQGRVVQAESPAPVDEITVEDRLDWNTKAASRGAKAGLKMLERGEAIISGGTTDSAILQAASNMVVRGMDTIERANRMQRLNGGLPTSYEKGETKTEGTVRHEYVEPERAREILRRELGLGHVKATGDAETVPN